MSYRKAASELHTKYTEMYLNQGLPLETASKKAYQRVSEALATFFGSDKFEKIQDKIDDMRRDFRMKKTQLETEYQTGSIDSSIKASELKQEWEVIRKEYDALKKKSNKFRRKG